MNDERQNSACAPPGSTFTPSPENLIRLSLEPPARPGPVGNLGRYEILKLIGSGGMGVVLLGRDTATSRLVAIKMVKPELAVEPRAVHRFLKEARHMERLSHPRILPVLQISDCPPTPYFVMPYVERGSLATALHERRPLAQRRVLKIAREVAAAIAHAHSKGLIHRDLKPGNVLLDADEGAYLTDFGLARTLFNDSLIDVAVDHRAGTAPYMSPSVAAGEAEDTRCDIYSFGALLYETLTGRPPYEGETTQAILKLIQA